MPKWWVLIIAIVVGVGIGSLLDAVWQKTLKEAIDRRSRAVVCEMVVVEALVEPCGTNQ